MWSRALLLLTAVTLSPAAPAAETVPAFCARYFKRFLLSEAPSQIALKLLEEPAPFIPFDEVLARAESGRPLAFDDHPWWRENYARVSYPALRMLESLRPDWDWIGIPADLRPALQVRLDRMREWQRLADRVRAIVSRSEYEPVPDPERPGETLTPAPFGPDERGLDILASNLPFPQRESVPEQLRELVRRYPRLSKEDWVGRIIPRLARGLRATVIARLRERQENQGVLAPPAPALAEVAESIEILRRYSLRFELSDEEARGVRDAMAEVLRSALRFPMSLGGRRALVGWSRTLIGLGTFVGVARAYGVDDGMLFTDLLAGGAAWGAGWAGTVAGIEAWDRLRTRVAWTGLSARGRRARRQADLLTGRQGPELPWRFQDTGAGGRTLLGAREDVERMGELEAELMAPILASSTAP